MPPAVIVCAPALRHAAAIDAKNFVETSTTSVNNLIIKMVKGYIIPIKQVVVTSCVLASLFGTPCRPTTLDYGL